MDNIWMKDFKVFFSLIISYLKVLFLLSVCLLQNGCGFKPVYQTGSNSMEILSLIEVLPISTIEGTYFYNHLKSIFPPTKETKYILDARLSFTKSYNIILSNSDILRETQNVKVTYQLIDKHSLKIITRGDFTKINSYGIDFSSYSNAVLKQESNNILAEGAAEEIRNRLIMFFN